MRHELATPVVVAVLLALSPAFAVGTAPAEDPASWDDLVKVGATEAALSAVAAGGGTVPRAQARYARYEYDVGYYGVGELVARLASPEHDREFGQTLAVHVTDFAGRGAHLTEAGYPAVESDATLDWVRAERASFVVESAARTPDGPTVVPFSDRAEATRFADRYGGRVVSWETLLNLPVAPTERSDTAWRETVAERSGWADRTVAGTRSLLARPVSTTVDPDDSVAAAVAAAPANTTVLLGPGVHHVSNLTVERPVTVRGAGPETVVLGDGTGTAVEFRADRSALADVRVAGVGDETVGNLSRASGWEERVRLAYAVADAGVRFVGANDSLVANVGVRTPANGVVFVDSDRGVVTGARVVGAATPRAGYMGVLTFRSRVVVQQTTVLGGRDAVYTHRSHGIVVRDSQFRSLRFGVHTMYTSRALVRNVTVRDADIGVVVMTRPSENAVVESVVTDTRTGLSVGGSRSYVADNVAFGNERGLTTATTGSAYTRNLVAENNLGARAGSILPTDRVSQNDFVDNEVHADDRPPGSLQVWTVDGVGNYWSDAPGFDRDGDGVLDRAYFPTDPVDGPATRAAGGATLAHAPVVSLLRATRTTVAGLRPAGVIDTAPLAAPAGGDPAARLAHARARVATVPARRDHVVAPVNETNVTRPAHATATAPGEVGA